MYNMKKACNYCGLVIKGDERMDDGSFGSVTTALLCLIYLLGS
jgi:hypothetical protein